MVAIEGIFQSTWFTVLVVVVVFAGILYNFSESADEAGVDLWGIAKGIGGFVIFLLFMPFVIIFGRTKARKEK